VLTFVAQPKKNTQMKTSELYSKQKLLQMMDQNDDEVRQLMDIFIRAVPEMLDRMQEFAENENWYDCGNIAHKLKSSARLWEISSVEADLIYIEEQGNTVKDTSRVIEKVKAVNNILRQIVSEMTLETSL